MNSKPSTTTHLHPSKGDVFVGPSGHSITIMGIVEGWAVVRGRCQPFVVHCNKLMASDYWQLHCEICELPRKEK